jgi:hypothetical protein
MLTAAAIGGLEVRADADGAVRLTGRFPYGVAADLAPGRAEVFAPGALEPRESVFLLSQHRWETPLASTRAGTLELRSTADALAFEATLPAEVAGTSHGRDALALIRSGLAVGLSPGFRVAPGGERVERRGDGLLRTITRADLHELSIVTRPAYEPAAVEARAWSPAAAPAMHSAAWRWR